MRVGRISAIGVIVAATFLTVPAASASSAASVVAHRPPSPLRVPAATASSPTSQENLAGVSCTSTSFCLAVGSYDGSTVAQVWNGSIWTVKTLAVSGSLTGVACASASDCIAVGSAPGGTDNQAMTELWNGTAWRVLNTPNTGGPASGLQAVSCSSASNCMAVGWGMPDDEGGLTLAIQWNGSAWTLLSTPPQDQEISPVLDGVSCLSSTNCMAVGSGGGSDGSAPLAVRWNGSTWTELDTPDTGTWFGVSCLAGGNCFAAGGNPDGSGYQTALAAEWDGSTWRDLPTTNPGGPVNTLNQISCLSHLARLRARHVTSPPVAVADDPPSGGNGGYVIVNANGSIAPFGDTATHGGETNGHATGIAFNPQGGYWIINTNGGISNFGAPWYGSLAGKTTEAPTGIAGY